MKIFHLNRAPGHFLPNEDITEDRMTDWAIRNDDYDISGDLILSEWIQSAEVGDFWNDHTGDSYTRIA